MNEETIHAASAAMLDELQELVRRVETGDQAALVPLRNWLEEHRTSWAGLGERTAALLASQFDAVAGDNEQVRVAIRQRLDDLRASVGYADATPLERLLIDRLTIASLDVQLVELLLLECDIADEAQANYLDRRLKRSSRRMVESAKQLKLLRKLVLQRSDNCG
jgi:hypothetical protein